MSYQISNLKNGLRVASCPIKDRKSVAIGIWVHTGGRHETPGENGLSHFLEHLVFKGTKRRTANQIKEAVEGVGGSLNAFTGEEYTAFIARIADRHADGVFDVLADMTLNASLKKEDIEKERTVIMEEIKMTQDQPSQLVDELMAEIVWPGHALGRPLAGTLESVGALTREQVTDYRDRCYRPNRISVVACGAVNHRRLMRMTTDHFGSGKPGDGATTEEFQGLQREPRIKLFYKKTEQTHLSLALRALPRGHQDEQVLEILSVVLGGNMSSRLFNEVREERGLAYDIGSFTRKYQETGIFGVSAGVDHRKLPEALGVILKELDKVAQKALAADELARAKEFCIGQLQLGLESSMNQMLWMGESLLTLGRCRAPEEVIQKIERVTAADLKRVARRVFQTNAISLAVVGPVHVEDRLHKLLKF